MSPLTILIKRFEVESNARRTQQLTNLKAIGVSCSCDDLYSSIALAHNDMSRRATGHTDNVKIASVRCLADRFSRSSPFTIGNQADFDKWHDESCREYLAYMNNQTFPKKFDMTYGRAQKVLNMTFKYLYCTERYKANIQSIEGFLHMTLDGYTLRWYKDEIVEQTKELKKRDVSEWSKMNEVGKHQYIDIQKQIREFLGKNSTYNYTINTKIIVDNMDEIEEVNEERQKKDITVSIPINPTNPFFAEFIVWEGEIVRAKVGNLFKGLNGIYKEIV